MEDRSLGRRNAVLVQSTELDLASETATVVIPTGAARKPRRGKKNPARKDPAGDTQRCERLCPGRRRPLERLGVVLQGRHGACEEEHPVRAGHRRCRGRVRAKPDPIIGKSSEYLGVRTPWLAIVDDRLSDLTGGSGGRRCGGEFHHGRGGNPRGLSRYIPGCREASLGRPIQWANCFLASPTVCVIARCWDTLARSRGAPSVSQDADVLLGPATRSPRGHLGVAKFGQRPIPWAGPRWFPPKTTFIPISVEVRTSAEPLSLG
jgi:hypothetical protein